GHRQPDPSGAPRGPAGPGIRTLRFRSRPSADLSHRRRARRAPCGPGRRGPAGAAAPGPAARPSAGPPRVRGSRLPSGASRATLAARYRGVALVGEELGDLYAAARLVIGRAGAGTVTELAALGLPAILIPLPGARGDEQTANARVLADAGAAVLLAEADLTPDRLVREVAALVGDPDRRGRMAARARALATPDAAERLVDLVLALGGRA